MQITKKQTNLENFTQFDERTLPPYLKEAIDTWVNRKEEDKYMWYDCFLEQLKGNLNMAYHGREISKEEFDYLRDKYL